MRFPRIHEYRLFRVGRQQALKTSSEYKIPMVVVYEKLLGTIKPLPESLARKSTIVSYPDTFRKHSSFSCTHFFIITRAPAAEKKKIPSDNGNFRDKSAFSYARFHSDCASFFCGSAFYFIEHTHTQISHTAGGLITEKICYSRFRPCSILMPGQGNYDPVFMY